MNTFTPEQIADIACWMHPEATINVVNQEVFYNYGKDGRYDINIFFAPLTNSKIIFDIVNKAKIDISFHADFDVVWTRPCKVGQWFKADTLEEAVILACLAAIEKADG